MLSSWISNLTRPVIVLSLICLISCDQLKETANSFAADAKKVNFSRSNVTYEDDECVTEKCATITVRSIQLSDNYRINQTIEKEIATIIGSFTRSNNAKNITEITNAFFEDYREFKNAFPESNTPWDVTLHITGDWINVEKGYLSIKIDTYSYTGGAHTNQEVSYLNLSMEGEKLDLMDWIADKDALLAIAEDAFRKQKQVDPMGSLNDAGYEFENNQFQLPPSLGFSDGELVLYYNPYEISSYAEGAIEIKIPSSELKGILKE